MCRAASAPYVSSSESQTPQYEIVPTTTLRSTCLLVLPYTTNSGSPEGARSPLLVSGTHSRACVG